MHRLDSNDPQIARGWRIGARVLDRVRCDSPGEVIRTLDAMQAKAQSLHATTPCRWIGWMSYDAAHAFEMLPRTARDDLRLPMMAFDLVADDESPQNPLPACTQAGRGQGAGRALEDTASMAPEREAYIDSVRRALDYIAAGDIFQVNLSQRFAVPTSESAQAIYARLLARSPATYAALLQFDAYALLSHSPELFLETWRDLQGQWRVRNEPIKGTRPLGPGMREALETSEKEKAELAMVVDLQRNDLGRVCSSVRVTQAREIRELPSLYHAKARIEGVLRDSVPWSELLAATFPCGSITGCPKIRAMQIINELEPISRGPYCGTIGVLRSDGSVLLNVAIRTIILKDAVAHVAVGGGIVADSDPRAEYEETLVKARPMLDALGMFQ